MTARSSLTVVLAAGEGTRMRSSLPKVLHPVAGQPLLAHVLDAAPQGTGASLAVVIGPDHKAVADEVKRVRPDAATFVQAERLGTAHAVLAARAAIARGADDLLVAFGDTPLISAATFARLRAPLEQGAALAVLGFRAADPTGYGRLLLEGDRLIAIREHADATPEERKVTLCNAGVMAFDGRQALEILDRIGNANSKGEYYLVDAVTIVREMGLEAVVIETSEDEVRGINTKAQLAEAEAVMQARLRKAALDAGVTLIAPETVHLAADTTFGSDVTIEPFVVIGPGVTIADGAVIHSFSHIVQASIGKKASVGPYARLRPGTSLGDGVRIGNFVETKAATIDAGAKVNHLSYVGDAHVGANANLGAGTITCNYDGFFKHKTTIGQGAFIGTNSSLVAPVKIGNGAYIGSGSVITKDVPDDAMAVERSPQSNREGGAAKYREMKMRAKAKKEGLSARSSFCRSAMHSLPVVLLLCENGGMRRLLQVMKTIATVVVGLGLIAVTTWWGLSQLYRVLSTGELFSRLYGPGYVVGWSRLISFDSDPIHFVAALGASVLVSVCGLFVFAQLFLKIRRWWSAR